MPKINNNISQFCRILTQLKMSTKIIIAIRIENDFFDSFVEQDVEEEMNQEFLCFEILFHVLIQYVLED
jgi:hypothetical protein